VPRGRSRRSPPSSCSSASHAQANKDAGGNGGCRGVDQDRRTEPQSGVRDAVIDESGLCRVVWLLLQSCPGKAADIEAETLAAFLAAVACGEPGRARLASRLCRLASIGASRLVQGEGAERARPGADPVSAAPPRP